MEKLFFTALIVTLAVGGSFASSFVPDLWSPGNSGAPDIECSGGTITCSLKYGINVAYTTAAPNQDEANDVDLSTLTAEPL